MQCSSRIMISDLNIDVYALFMFNTSEQQDFIEPLKSDIDSVISRRERVTAIDVDFISSWVSWKACSKF